MKKKLMTLGLLALSTTLIWNSEDAKAIDSSQVEIPMIGTELDIPQNTECRMIDFANDTKRTQTTATQGKDFYDLCIGSFPRFPSTSTEGGVEPYYYAKYRFFPEPMPYYNVTTTPRTINGTTIIGIDQSFVLDESYEGRRTPLDDTNKDIFLHYPYDKEHESNAPEPNPEIKGPYQVGYNSFYHNGYRSRYFASEVKFEFEVREPYMNTGATVDDKVTLFEGEIIYRLPDACYRTDYLDYTDQCREIEFYFPKSPTNLNGPTELTENEAIMDITTYDEWETAELTDTIGIDQSSKNVIPKGKSSTITNGRLPYKNPGEHELILTVTENTQLRYQKDEGATVQRIANYGPSSSVVTANNPTPQENAQGAGDYDKSSFGAVYFPRGDINGGGINPNIESLRGGKYPILLFTNTGVDILEDSDGDGHLEYNPRLNEKYSNYCDVDTDAWGQKNYEHRSGSTPNSWQERAAQNDKMCYHNEGEDYHWWEYYWADTKWYANDPYKW